MAEQIKDTVFDEESLKRMHEALLRVAEALVRFSVTIPPYSVKHSEQDQVRIAFYEKLYKAFAGGLETGIVFSKQLEEELAKMEAAERTAMLGPDHKLMS